MKITILAGSVHGNAYAAADAAAQQLAKQGHQIVLSKQPQVSDLQGKADAYLIITSTTGRGDLPYNMSRFAEQCYESRPVITGKPYGVIGLGSSNYYDFCGGGEKMDEMMQALMAKRVSEMCRIDTSETYDPVPRSLEWLASWLNQLPEQTP